MASWEDKVKHEEAMQSAAFARMKAAQQEGNRRAENKAWRECQKHRDNAARYRAFANKWEVSSHGFDG